MNKPEVIITKTFLHELEKLPPHVGIQIKEALDKLGPPNITPSQVPVTGPDGTPMWMMPINNYRLLFKYEKEDRILVLTLYKKEGFSAGFSRGFS